MQRWLQRMLITVTLGGTGVGGTALWQRVATLESELSKHMATYEARHAAWAKDDKAKMEEWQTRARAEGAMLRGIQDSHRSLAKVVCGVCRRDRYVSTECLKVCVKD